jgi:hypothetical protein
MLLTCVSEACGGPNRVSVYSSDGNITIIPVPVIKNSSLPGQWSYQGCLTLVVLHGILHKMLMLPLQRTKWRTRIPLRNVLAHQ